MSHAGGGPPPRPTVGVGVVALCGRRALLARRARPPRAGEWSLPGGRQEWGETVTEAARRELVEETGLHAGRLHLLDVADGILRNEAGRITHHFTLIDFWTEVTEEAAETVRPGGDAAAVRWAAAQEIDRLVVWAETRRVCRLAFKRRAAA